MRTMPIAEDSPNHSNEFKVLQCITCQKICPNSDSWESHWCEHQLHITDHLNQPYPALKCTDCNKLFNNLRELQLHLQKVQHPNELTCRFCGRSNFTSSDAIQEHKAKIHGNEEIFKSYICGRRYYLEANLLSRVRRHAKREPQTCVVCGKVTLRLQHHLKFKHSPRPTRLLQCHICDKIFSYTSSLSRHWLLHKLPYTE